MELNIVSKRLLLEHRAFILKSHMTQWECAMNIFYIIGVVVVIVLVAGFLGGTRLNKQSRYDFDLMSSH
jgi:hypothetical protein